MNKSELVSRLTERLGGDRAIAAAAVNGGVLEEIESSVARGETGLAGRLRHVRPARARGAHRQEPTDRSADPELAASVAPVFRPGAGFRSLLTQNGDSTAVKASPMVVAPTDVVSKKKTAKKTSKKSVGADAGKSGKKAKQAEKKTAKKTGKKGR